MQRNGMSCVVPEGMRTRKIKLLVLKAALALIGAAIPCLAAELILRLLAPPADTPGLFVELPSEIEYSGRPHAQGLLSGVPVHFNAFGLRERERSSERTPGTTRILALGDSVTFGQGVSEDDTFPRVTEALLNASRRNGEPPVEILNFGVPGYNTSHELAQLQELGLAFHPDVVVVGFLYNDLEMSPAQRLRHTAAEQPGADRNPSSAPPTARSIRSRINAGIIYLKQHSLFVSWLSPRLGVVLRPFGIKGFGQVGETKDQFVDANPDWQRVQAALLKMKALCAERTIQLVIVIIPAMAAFTDSGYPIKEYHEAVASFCQANGIACLDLLPAFWGLDGAQFWISPTDGHPNAQGHRIMAEALTKFLAPLLADIPARD